MDKLMEMLGTELGPVAAIGFVLVGYLVITIDRSRISSPSKDDNQVGLKLVLFGLVIAGVQLASSGVAMFLGYALGGFKGGASPVKVALPPMIIGTLIVLGVTRSLMPRTNTNTYRQCERFMLGAVGLEYGVTAIMAANLMLTGLFTDGPWTHTAQAFALTAVNGAVAFLAITRFGAVTGWTMPPPPSPPPPPHPPHGFGPPGGFPPPQGGAGFPPVQGGGGGYGPPPTGENPYAPR